MTKRAATCPVDLIPVASRGLQHVRTVRTLQLRERHFLHWLDWKFHGQPGQEAIEVF